MARSEVFSTKLRKIFTAASRHFSLRSLSGFGHTKEVNKQRASQEFRYQTNFRLATVLFDLDEEIIQYTCHRTLCPKILHPLQKWFQECIHDSIDDVCGEAILRTLMRLPEATNNLMERKVVVQDLTPSLQVIGKESPFFLCRSQGNLLQTQTVRWKSIHFRII